MRRITAMVEVNGVDIEMFFFSNNLDWAASSICDLYKARWNIETFFKQTLHLGSFLGHSRNAIQWQVWTALLMYVLLRFLHTCSEWGNSFTRLFTSLRSVLWQRRCLFDYLRSYGTAGDAFREMETMATENIKRHSASRSEQAWRCNDLRKAYARIRRLWDGSEYETGRKSVEHHK